MYLFSELNILPALLLLALWTLGGWLITARTFDLPAHERILVGLGVGLVTGTWLANWLARFVGPDLAFWGAALLTIALGLAMSWPLNRSLFTGSPNSEWKVPTHRANVSSVKQPGGRVFQPGGLLLFLFFVFVFTLIGRGFGFFDDHQNLAPVSIMATGDIPPHFSYNPDLRFGYHYFLLLVASQFVRLAAAGPWTALDLARGLTLTLTLTYGGFVAVRITKSKLAGAASMVFMAFAGGARWLFFLLPLVLQRQLSSSITLIGSGADTGPNLITAIYKNWKIEGAGPLPLPFMFGSGLDPSFSMFHNGWGTSAITLALLLMLLAGVMESTHKFSMESTHDLLSKSFSTVRQRLASIPIIILLASMALANEVTFAFLYFGLAFAALTLMLLKRTWRLPRSLWMWVGMLFIGGVFALIQGGMFTEIARGWVDRQVSGGGGSTYFKVGFAPGSADRALGAPRLSFHAQTVAMGGDPGRNRPGDLCHTDRAAQAAGFQPRGKLAGSRLGWLDHCQPVDGFCGLHRQRRADRCLTHAGPLPDGGQDLRHTAAVGLAAGPRREHENRGFCLGVGGNFLRHLHVWAANSRHVQPGLRYLS